MKDLFEYKIPITEFTKYLKSININAQSILLSKDFRLQLGYILEFLNKKRIFCIADNFNYLVYTDGMDATSIEYIKKTKSPYVIYESNVTQGERDILENYKYAIEHAFKFLDTPF